MYLGREALAVTAPRGIEVNKDEIEGGNGRIEVGFIELQHFSIYLKFFIGF